MITIFILCFADQNTVLLEEGGNQENFSAHRRGRNNNLALCTQKPYLRVSLVLTQHQGERQ